MGCLRNIFTGIGCGTVLIVGAAFGYHYRAQLKGLAESFRAPDAVAVAESSAVGVPSPEALARARRKEARMADPRGPATVTLTADELASMISDGFEAGARHMLDSVTVVLAPDRLLLAAQLRTAGIDRGLLGPLGDFVDAREPIRMGGGAAVRSPGVVGYRPDELALRAFPFPESLVPRLVNVITGGADGTVPIGVPGTVGDLRIRADGVTFYRRTD